MINKLVLVTFLISACAAQRPGYAGSRPYGYPVIISTTTSTVSTPAASTDSLGNRFGDDLTTTPAPRIPLEANGDVNLINFLSKLPQDQQPFWFLNWQALEQQRQRPQTYQIRDNGYLDIPPPARSQQDPAPMYRSMYLN